LTLIELMVAIAVAGVLLAVAVPSLTRMMERSRLEGIGNQLGVDLQYTRSEALRQRSAATLLVDGAGASYTVSAAGATLKTVPAPNGITLTPSQTIDFDPLRGLSNAATIDAVATVSGLTLRIGTNAAGRVRICSPSGPLPGYATC
jgi:type IV fimbrial biogenesis protein FimT